MRNSCKKLPRGTLVYLSAIDFEKVKIYCMEFHAWPFLDYLQEFEGVKQAYGFLPEAYQKERENLIRNSLTGYVYENCMCVNIDTGEVFEKSYDITNHKGAWVSL